MEYPELTQEHLDMFAEGEHMTDGTDCWCDPTIEIVDGNVIVIHNEDLQL